MSDTWIAHGKTSHPFKDRHRCKTCIKIKKDYDKWAKKYPTIEEKIEALSANGLGN